MQLMSDGFIHCDPHEGNLLGLPDGRRAPRPRLHSSHISHTSHTSHPCLAPTPPTRLALLDFGLMAQMRTDHQEAMAHGVVNILGENYEALEQALEATHAHRAVHARTVPRTRAAHTRRAHAPCTTRSAPCAVHHAPCTMPPPCAPE